MKVSFYGTRGSISTPGKKFALFGGNTACLLVEFSSGQVAILDAGTGLLNLGNDIVKGKISIQQDNVFIGITHTHWDHIHGFPFFKPAYDKNRKFTIAMGGRKQNANSLESAFKMQMNEDFFPVPLTQMGASIKFWEPSESEFADYGDVKVSTINHNHPGGAHSYRIEDNGSVLVYCTDVEHVDGIDSKIVEIAKEADLLVHDAQYTPEKLLQRRGWGHSSWTQAVEVAMASGAKKLALFHHDPEHTDSDLLKIEEESKNAFPDCFIAREGDEIII